MIRRLPRRRAKRLSLITVLVVMLGPTATAVAYFGATGTSHAASATVGTLTVPTIASATAGAGTVALSWSAVAPPAAGAVTYYVTRDGGAPAGTCPTSSTTATASTSCTDSGVSAGLHTYRVIAVWQSWTATSAGDPVTLASAAASKLVFTSQPSGNVTAGASTTVAVSVEDASSNVVTTDSTTAVTLAIGSNPGTSTLTCTNSGATGPVTVAAGVASFSCSLNKAGTAYTLTATSSPAHGTATSSSFNIVTGAAGTVAVQSGSSQSATVGAAFASPLVALVTDAGGNPVSGAMVTFTAPASGASGTFANATRTTTATTGSNGQATSSAFTANTTSGAYTVTASVTGAVSASFALTNSPATASKLAFTVQPATGASVTAGTPTGVAVSLEDANGNVETGDGTTTMTLAIGTNPGTSALTCTNSGGKGPVTVVAGVAGFTCSLNKVGTGYTLTATSSPTHGTATSNAFNIVAGAAATVAVQSGSPQSTTVSTAFANPLVALVTDADGNPVSGVTVTFTAPGSGASGRFANGTTTTTAVTAADGQATASAFTANATAGAYTVSAAASGATSASFSLTNTSLAITSVARAAGNKKVDFSGTGAAALTTITVTICAVNSFPCASPVGTSVATSPTAGSWTSGQDSNNLAASQTYYAEAVQGAATSAVYTFSTTGL